MDNVGAMNDVDVLGKNDYDICPDYSAAISIEEDQFVFNTCKSLFNKETPSFKKEGTQTWFLSLKIPFINDHGEITALLGISYNITIRNELNRALEAVKQKHNNLFVLSPVGFALSEFESGRFIKFNNCFAIKLGYTPDELKNLSRLKIKPKKYWANEREVIQALDKDNSHSGRWKLKIYEQTEALIPSY